MAWIQTGANTWNDVKILYNTIEKKVILIGYDWNNQELGVTYICKVTVKYDLAPELHICVTLLKI